MNAHSAGVQLRPGDAASPVCVHVGAGLIAPATWVNLDASWNARLAKHPRLRRLLGVLRIIPKPTAKTPWPSNILIHDIRSGLPFTTASVDAVYGSHVIEHVSVGDAHQFVREAFRVLKPGGRIRLVTPDLEYLAAAYLQAKRDGSAPGDLPAGDFLNGLGLLQSFENTSLLTRIYRYWKAYDLHKWLYDDASLKLLLSGGGFTQVERRGYLESEIPNLRDVELEDRLRGAVCVEGIKPQEA